MSPESKPRFGGRARAWVGSGVLLAATAHLLGMAHGWRRATERFDAAFESPPGAVYSEGMAEQIFLDNDPCYWLTYAREMAEEGRWRIRWNRFDNTPVGRPVFWSQSVSWGLAGLGGVRRAFTGESWTRALERAALWLNPLLHVAFLWVTSLFWRRRFGPAPAILWTLMIAAMGDLTWCFHALRPDHQTLHFIALIGGLLALMGGGFGWVSESGSASENDHEDRVFAAPSLAAARRCFALAGALTGIGLWVGATIVVFGLAAMGGGLLVLAYASRPSRGGGVRLAPELWRRWGAWAAGTAFVFWLIEFAPGPVHWGLEINHPAFWVFVLALAELLARLLRRRLRGARTRSDIWVLPLCAAVIAALPLAILFGPAGGHAMRDPLMRRLHDFIMEFYNLPRFSGGRPLRFALRVAGALPLAWVGALYWMRPGAGGRATAAALWTVYAYSLFFAITAYAQVRWSAVYIGSAIVLATLVIAVWIRARRPGRGARIGLAAAMIALAAAPVWQGVHEWRQIAIVHRRSAGIDAFMKAALMKRLCARLGAAKGGQDWRFLCEPDLAGPLFYYGRIPSVTSFYWENLDGLRAAAAFLADRSPSAETARAVAAERRLTHYMTPLSPELAIVFHYIATGVLSKDAARGTLAAGLLGSGRPVPDWIDLDHDLTAIGRSEYLFHSAQGPVKVHTSLGIYRIEPPTTPPEP